MTDHRAQEIRRQMSEILKEQLDRPALNPAARSDETLRTTPWNTMRPTPESHQQLEFA